MNKNEGYQLVKNGTANAAFRLDGLPAPTCGPADVLVQVSHFGLNYADVMARLGLYNDCPPLPCVLGYEVVGTVTATGSNVKSVQLGQTVLAFTRFGGYARQAVVPELACVPLGLGTNAAEACALATQYCTAWYAAHLLANVQEGEKVLVYAAAGGVGLALCQLASLRGAVVVGCVGSLQKTEAVKAAGAQSVYSYSEPDFSDQLRRDHRQFDVVFDPVGGRLFRTGLAMLSAGGRLVSFGASSWSQSKGGFFDKLQLAWNFGIVHPIGLLMKSRSVMGLNMLRIADQKPELLKRCMHEVYELYRQGKIKPTVNAVMSHTQLAEAHTMLEQRQTVGKLVMRWQAD